VPERLLHGWRNIGYNIREREKMNYPILKNSTVYPYEIESLREAVGWDRSEGIYGQVLKRQYAYYTVHIDSRLVGYLSVLSDGVADAFLLDLMVHPDYQRIGIGSSLVQRAVSDIKQEGIRCVQVTFDDRLEPFYKKCGFHIFKGGIIDFKDVKGNTGRKSND
jgi:ribosomal protein S18 acetylase RimI-like enzyme